MEAPVQDAPGDGQTGQQDFSVLICGDAPLESEANASIRGSIRDGWIDALSAGRVFTASLDSAVVAIQTMRPNLVLCVGSYLPETAYFGEATRAAREMGSATAFWATEDPYEKDASYRIERHFDAIFTCDRWTQRFYDHPRVFHLPLAACPRRHHVPQAGGAERPIDLLFCGVAFANRREIMDRLMPSLEGLRICVTGPGWGGFGAGFSDGRVDKRRLIELYGQSKIVLNLGRSLNFENNRYQIAASTPGPRTFEAAMAGALQFFHEDTLEIRDYFDDDEVPGFSGAREFRHLRDRFLGSTELRASTAGRAQERALAEHTYVLRARRVIDTLSREGLL
jgi:spore maturation protein CgeB